MEKSNQKLQKGCPLNRNRGLSDDRFLLLDHWQTEEGT